MITGENANIVNYDDHIAGKEDAMETDYRFMKQEMKMVEEAMDAHVDASLALHTQSQDVYTATTEEFDRLIATLTETKSTQEKQRKKVSKLFKGLLRYLKNMKTSNHHTNAISDWDIKEERFDMEQTQKRLVKLTKKLLRENLGEFKKNLKRTLKASDKDLMSRKEDQYQDVKLTTRDLMKLDWKTVKGMKTMMKMAKKRIPKQFKSGEKTIYSRVTYEAKKKRDGMRFDLQARDIRWKKKRLKAIRKLVAGQ